MPANPQVTDEMSGFDKRSLQIMKLVTEQAEEIRRLTAALADHVVVPRIPSDAMIKAGFRTLGWTSNTEGARQDATSVYRAMISAASPSVSQEG
jgi:hypothetical protein